ncbi:MAG TPA: hypothetical protein PLZ08_08425 [Bacillota bacterium]|nr:hypothetical protein [Bacillota bacterium]HOL09969.1 hypothetical protein [Bacillota bacterium]HPO97968.1 hypothetical protein [Bacillota bacterium]
MNPSFSPGTLQLMVKNDWIVESLMGLGSGYLAHLAYQYSEISPEVKEAIQNGNLGEGVLGEIIHLGSTVNRIIAKIEIEKINRFDGFIRFDFRLLEVRLIKNSLANEESQYLCCFKKSPG